MLKKILRYLRYIVIAVLAVFCVFALVMVDRGRKLASSVMEETPISAAVEPYFSMSTWTDYEDLDPKFVEAVVSVEDQRYFKRYGFDWPALIRAVFNNMMARSFVEGGSTISQQIAKNLYFQSAPRGVTEKIAEVYIMYRLEATYSKQTLFALYVNMNYYGDGYWGIREASEGYYGVEPDDLTLGQAAMLAGIPNAPGYYQLSTGYDAALRRMHKVLNRMRQESYITDDERQGVMEEDMRPLSVKKSDTSADTLEPTDGLTLDTNFDLSLFIKQKKTTLLCGFLF